MRIGWQGRLLSFPVAGCRLAHERRQQRQGRATSRHEDGGQALFGAPQDQAEAERLAFRSLEVLVMAHQHDAVERGDTQHDHETDQRPQRQHAAGEPRGEHPTDERKGERQGHQQRQSPRLQIRQQQDQDSGQSQGREGQQPAARLLPGRIFTEEFRMVTARRSGLLVMPWIFRGRGSSRGDRPERGGQADGALQGILEIAEGCLRFHERTQATQRRLVEFPSSAGSRSMSSRRRT